MIDLNVEINRRKYERTIRLICLAALDRLFPGKSVRVEYSVASGVLIRLPQYYLTRSDLERLSAVMREMIEEDAPITEKTISHEEAARIFAERGRADKVRLLAEKPVEQRITLASIGNYVDHVYGSVFPSAGNTPYFILLDNYPGFVLQLPNKECQNAPAPYVSRPKHLNVFAESTKWCDIMGINNMQDIAELLHDHKMREFIRVNEALQDRAIAGIAENIVNSGSKIVLVAGPSSSGKTTFSARLGVHLRVHGRKYLRVSMDDYYRNRADIEPGPDGKPDLEALSALDVPLLREQLAALAEGKEVEIPRFNFHTQSREAKGVPTRLEDHQVLILEGIHGLNPEISNGLKSVYRVFISALTCLNLDDHNRIRTTDVRLLRRIVRDWSFRGTSPEGTIAMWDSVRAGEERWIFPYQESADSMFNSALHYELPVLKSKVCKEIEQIDASMFPLAQGLLVMLNDIPSCDSDILDEIPPTSLLREFIGGCTIEKK